MPERWAVIADGSSNITTRGDYDADLLRDARRPAITPLGEGSENT